MHVGASHQRSGISIEELWHIAVRGQREEIRALLPLVARSRADDVTTLTIRALDAVHAAEVPIATVLLQRAAAVATPEESEYVLDLLVPLLTSRGDFDRARELIEARDGHGARLAPSALALHSFVLAAHADFAGSRRLSDQATAELLTVEQPLFHGHVLYRLALAAYFRREFAASANLALESVQWALRGGGHRNAAMAYSLLHQLACCVHEDSGLASWYANAVKANATLSGDLSLLNRAWILELELASALGDGAQVDLLLAERERARVPEQYAEESFAIGLVRVLRAGWIGRFDLAQAAIDSVRKTVNCSLPHKSTCDVLEAIVNLAAWNLHVTRTLARRVLSQTVTPTRNEHLYDAYMRRVARTLAALICLAIGDGVRGRRALTARADAFVPPSSLADLIDEDGIHEDIAPPLLTGYVRFLSCAIKASAARRPRARLSAAETEVLYALCEGTTLADVAKGLGKSPKTVRCQVSSIYAKLDASNRTQALRRAAELGLTREAVASAS